MRDHKSGRRARRCVPWAVALAAVALAGGSRARAEDFANFESAQVHPIAASADGSQVFAVNTPDDRLSIFDVEADGSLTLDYEVVVGLEPVSLAVRGSEVWVVNHLSDSVSVVDTVRKQLVATIATGDEPTDVVFANGRAFVSLAGARDQVKVYDAATRALVGQLDIPGDDPRALAASANGSEVYLAVLESGNATTSIDPERDGGSAPPPSPPRSPYLPLPPKNALIVQFNPATGQWEDEYGGPHGEDPNRVVPDNDVFVLNTTSLALVRAIRGVGTTLFDVAVQPGSGDLFVPNTDARNLVRFEPNLRGHFVDTRLTKVDPQSGDRTFLDLNAHIDFGVATGPPEEVESSIGTPVAARFRSDGSTCYVAAFGSAMVAAVNPSDGSVTSRIRVGGGPSGLALVEPIGRLYVTNRFDNTISIVDTAANVEVGRIGIAGPAAFDPSPDVVRSGRHLLYDTTLSGHGESSCASCHVFGNFDGIAWDLGDPTGTFLPYTDVDWVEFAFDEPPRTRGFHPMKGPMVTQTLRGLDGMEPFHWRGDRRNFQHFNGAFVSLMGRSEPLATDDMDLFAAFADTIRMPPNPNRALDDTLPPTVRVKTIGGFGQYAEVDPAQGSSLYFDGVGANRAKNCVDCHTMPNGTSNKLNSSPLMPQEAKISQLRNLYEKVGFDLFELPDIGNNGSPEQKSGFGVLHDGQASLSKFLFAYFLDQNISNDALQSINAFVMAFPTGTPAITGHQLTIDRTSARNPDSDAAIELLTGQAALGNCDLVAHGVVGGQSKSFVFDVDGNAFVPDSREEASIDDVALRSSLVDGDVLTFMAVPAGSGVRMGIDRDRDTWRNSDELVEGSDATDIESTPAECRGMDDGSLDRVSLKIREGDDGEVLVAVRGEVDVSGRETPAIDLVSNGLIVDVRDANGSSVFRRWVRPGSLDERVAGKWKLRKGATDAGVRRAGVRAKDNSYRFGIQVTVPAFALGDAEFPIEVIAVLGAADQDAANQCGRTAFERGDCRLDPDRAACR